MDQTDQVAAIKASLGASPLVLASASPRRHRLLGGTGLTFVIDPADADETINHQLGADAIAEDLALRKARIVSSRLTHAQASALVLGSDTVVVLGEDGDPARCFLEKAADEEEARSMLQALSGTRHRVITGVAVALAARPVDEASMTPPARQEVSDHETTWVTMRVIDAAEIDAYVASGEWRGKAGAYAIQESADKFVSCLEGGGLDNVVGLPVARTLDLLQRAAALLR